MSIRSIKKGHPSGGLRSILNTRLNVRHHQTPLHLPPHLLHPTPRRPHHPDRHRTPHPTPLRHRNNHMPTRVCAGNAALHRHLHHRRPADCKESVFLYRFFDGLQFRSPAHRIFRIKRLLFASEIFDRFHAW